MSATKFMSSATFATVAAISVLAIRDPNNMLFWFISGGGAVVVARPVLAALILIVGFKSRIRNTEVRRLLGCFGIALIGFGLVGFFSSNFLRTLKPLDLILAVELGVILCIGALNNGVAAARKESLFDEHLPDNQLLPGYTLESDIPVSAMRKSARNVTA